MTPEDQLIHIIRHRHALREAVDVLERAALPTDEVARALRTLIARADTYIPASYPTAYRIRATARSVTEHLTENRDMIPANLHSPTSNGRIFTLTSAQRGILAERYGMTPTTEVVVTEVDVWPADTTCVRSITIKSTEHIPDTRKHILSACVIDDWVAFCTAVDTRAANDLVIKERERLSARLDRLWDRAERAGVTPTIKPGKILTRWWAAIDALPTSDDRPAHIRDALRDLLIEHGEHALAALIREPAYYTDDTERSAKRDAAAATFKDLLAQYL